MGINIGDNKYRFYLKLYYEFGGSIEWLKGEIIKKRYDSFKYLLPTKDKEKYDLVVEVYSFKGDEQKYISITCFLKFISIINIPKIVFKDLKISSDEWCSIYSFLKETYFEE